MYESQTFDVATARRGLAQRGVLRRDRLLAMASEAQGDFCRIRDMLVRDYQPRRIYQWGSLLHLERFQEISDIDIAVEGREDPMTGLHALDDACRMTRFPVDLVEVERIHPAHAAHADTIRKEGRQVI